MNMLDQLRSKQISTHTAVICVVSFLAVAGVSLKMVINSANAPAAPVHVSSPKPGSPRVEVNAVPAESRTSAGDKPVLAVKTADNPYKIIFTRDLFHPVGPGGSSSPTPSPNPNPGQRPVPPMPIVPLPSPNRPPGGGGDSEIKKSLAFTGSVSTSKGAQALIENISTKEIRFVSQGETAFGCRVVSIGSQTVSLDKDGAQFTLALGENKPDTVAGGAPPSGGSPPGGSPPGGSPPSGGPTPANGRPQSGRNR